MTIFLLSEGVYQWIISASSSSQRIHLHFALSKFSMKNPWNMNCLSIWKFGLQCNFDLASLLTKCLTWWSVTFDDMFIFSRMSWKLVQAGQQVILSYHNSSGSQIMRKIHSLMDFKESSFLSHVPSLLHSLISAHYGRWTLSTPGLQDDILLSNHVPVLNRSDSLYTRRSVVHCLSLLSLYTRCFQLICRKA